MARASEAILAFPALLALLACGGASSGSTRTLPVIESVAPRPVLAEMPYDQPFTFVPASVLFTGVTTRDSSSFQREGARRIRETIAIPLATLGWYETDSARARFRVAVLHADGPSMHWREVRQPGSRLGACWLVASTGRLHRGFAIERVSDGAVFSRIHRGGALDAATADAFLSAELLKLLLLQQPARADALIAQPPAGARRCPSEGAERDRPSSLRPPPVVAPPVPSAPPRRP